jgi:WD40 repeat protein
VNTAWRRVSPARTSRAFLKGTVIAAALAVMVPATAQATVSTVPDDTAKVAGGVYGMALANGKTYIGGQFTKVGGKARANVAAINNATGTVDLTFNPGTDGRVRAVAASEDGSMIFVGGTFTTAGGEPHANLAAVDATTGQPIANWQADTVGANPVVNSLAVSGNRLYVGGSFGGIDGSTRKRLVVLDATTGDLISAFKPAPNSNITEVVVSPDGSTVFASGFFTSLGGQARLYAGGVDAVTGTATAWNPTGSGGSTVTIALSPDGSRVFYGTSNNTVFAYDWATSNDPVWFKKMSGNTQAIVVTDDEMWIGGHFSQSITDHEAHAFIASIDPSNGSLNAWDPQCAGGKMGVWALDYDGTHLHAGGVFATWAGVAQRGYARFAEL